MHLFKAVILTGITAAISVTPVLACETQPDISQLPGESQKDAQARFEKTHDDQWVIRRYQRESTSFAKATTVYVARVTASNREQGSSSKPTSTVQPIDAVKGPLPIQHRTLSEVSSESCSDLGDGYGDGQGSTAEVGSLVIVFEGLPKSDWRPNGVDSLYATSVRTYELVQAIYKHGKAVPEDVLWGRTPPAE